MTLDNNQISNPEEKARQDAIPWQRGEFFAAYENVIGHYMVRNVEEHLIKPALLDVACGHGVVTDQLAHHFERVVGLDASSVHIAEARERFPEIEFVEALAEDYVADRPFSTITMLNLLEHVVDPVTLLKHMARNLTPDGVMIINVPNAMAVNRRIAKRMGTLLNEYELSPYDINIAGHRRYYDLPTLIEHVEKAGLHVKDSGGIFYKSLSSAQMNWFLENGLWESGGFGWGRVGSEDAKDWRQAFCDACYELGKEQPEDCNLVYVVAQR